MRYPSPIMRGHLINLSRLKNWAINGFITVVLILAMLAMIAAIIWGATAPRSGTVEATWLEPAHMETYQSGSICYTYDEYGQCTFSMPLYSERWVPDHCYITINDKEVTKRKATWNIPCYEKDTYKLGSWINLGD
jgi:hypothetical protein